MHRGDPVDPGRLFFVYLHAQRALEALSRNDLKPHPWRFWLVLAPPHRGQASHDGACGSGRSTDGQNLSL